MPLGAQAARHVLSPHRRHRTGGAEPGVHRPVHQPRPRARAPFSSHTPTIGRGRLYIGGRAGASSRSRCARARSRCCAARPASPARTSGSRAAGAASSWQRPAEPVAHRRDHDEHAERFTALRPLLFTIAYEILGTATESDDVLQESYLRWAEVDLATVQRHQGLSRPARHPAGAQRAAGRRPGGARSTSGRGCPSRCCSTSRTPPPTSCSPSRCRWRCWWCSRRSSPDERAVFVLREVFGFELRRNRLGGRQVHAPRCARSRTAPASTCRPGASGSSPSTRSSRLEITAQFFAAAATGDMDAADGDAGARRGVDGRQRRQGQRGPAARSSAPEKVAKLDHRPDPPRRRRRPRRAGCLQQRPGAGALPRRPPRGRHHRRDHRRPDQPTSTPCAIRTSWPASRSRGRSAAERVLTMRLRCAGLPS